jgi:acyl-CoA thioester hydrolase
MTPLFTQVLDVRWREMDALGHVNNAQFLSYVEEARVQWLATLRDNWQNSDHAPIVAAIHVDFRQPIVWPEQLRVSLFAERRGGKSATIAHRITRASDASVIYAEGYTVLVWVARSGTPVALPDYIAEFFS